ncbi:MAG: hypothetical protein JXD22_16925 [Sedimentisphaerales bacterium]|nr:hypothetical protein [Sedimentisphaerales bacterium]
MKDSSEYGAKLKKLCNRLQRSGGKVEVMEGQDIVTEILLACLSVYTTESKARTALSKLRSSCVDYNELRVHRISEVMEVLGKNFPQSRDAARQLLALLQSIYSKEDCLDLEHLKDVGKREGKAYLESLDGSSTYMVSRATLFGLGGHAFPINEQMLTMLREEEVVDKDASEAEVQGFLERQFTASRIHKVYALLRQYADDFKPAKSKKVAKKQAASKKATTKKSKTKKSGTTKSAKKVTKKKSTNSNKKTKKRTTKKKS